MPDPELGRIPELAPRKLPSQRRSRQRVDRILDTAARLLGEVGVDALTTNLIAERAGVRVASLYQYFPNKYAILGELARRDVEAQLRQLDRVLSDRGFAGPWPEVLDELLDALMPHPKAQAASVAIRLAVSALPELADIRRREAAAITSRLSSALRGAGARADHARISVVADTVYATATAVLNQAMAGDARTAAALLGELKLLLRNYLAEYLD